MPKTMVTPEELLRWMNYRLARLEACKGCVFTSVTRLKGEDQDGCNWDPPHLRCSGTPVSVCQPAAKEVVQKARTQFNLE